MDSQNMYDLTLLNDYGWSIEQVEAVKELPQVVDVEGTVYVDVIGTVGDSQTEAVYEVYSIPQEVNQLYLLEGRMPEAPNECLADANLQDSTDLNDQFRIADTNEDGLGKALRRAQVGGKEKVVHCSNGRAAEQLG